MVKVCIASIVLVIACTTDEDSDTTDDVIAPLFCGDNICNAGETPTSCQVDCPATACTTNPDNCTGEAICVEGQCIAAFPRVYRITDLHASVPTSINGAAWDPFGGAPDLFVGLADGSPITAFVVDAFTASFSEPLDISLAASGFELALGVFDDDSPASPDGAFVCRYPIHALELRSRVVGCSGSLGLLIGKINPR